LRVNYGGNKRRKEEARKKKQEEKRNKRLNKSNPSQPVQDEQGASDIVQQS